MSPSSGTSECMLHGPLTALIIGTSTSSTLEIKCRAYQAFSSSLSQSAGAGHQQIVGLFDRVAVGHASPVGVVVLAGAGVDEHLDLAVAGDIGERVRHLVVCPPVPHQAAAVGVALHEQDAVVSELEPIVRRTGRGTRCIWFVLPLSRLVPRVSVTRWFERSPKRVAAMLAPPVAAVKAQRPCRRATTGAKDSIWDCCTVT